MGQKGLKLAFLAKNSCFLADFFLNGIGGSPPPPLNGKSQKKILNIDSIYDYMIYSFVKIQFIEELWILRQNSIKEFIQNDFFMVN